MSVPENTPAIDKAERHNKVLLWFIAMGVGALVLAMAVTFYLRLGDSAKQSTTQHSVDAVVQSARRADCARAYNAIFTDVDRRQRVAAADGQVTLARYLIGDPTVTPAVLASVRAEVDAANTQLKALPSINDAVDHGFTFEGKKYPPCAVVK